MSQKIKRPSFGSDPEYAILLNGTPVSGVGYLPGTKKKPFQMDEHTSCQTDNVGAELCISPSDNVEDFVKYMNLGRNNIETLLQQTMPGANLASLSSARYSPQELNSEQAMEFGCEPSFCCYTGIESPRPRPEDVGNLRSFGFHIHIGFKPNEHTTIELYELLVKAMDINLGVASIIIDNDAERRQIYGNAGDFRFKRVNEDLHIVEYRTLGAAMHASDERLRFCFQQTLAAIDMVNNCSVESINQLGETAEEIINNGDVDAAIAFVNKMGIIISESIHENQYQNVCQC